MGAAYDEGMIEDLQGRDVSLSWGRIEFGRLIARQRARLLPGWLFGCTLLAFHSHRFIDQRRLWILPA